MAYTRFRVEVSAGDFVVGSCCAIANIDNFYRDGYINGLNQKEKEAYIGAVKQEITGSISSTISRGKSILLATLTSEQKIAESLLLEFGFVSAQPEYAYRSPRESSNSLGVKVYTLNVLGVRD